MNESNVSATYTNLASDEHCDNLIDFLTSSDKDLNYDRFDQNGCETKSKESGVDTGTKEDHSGSDIEDGRHPVPPVRKPLNCKRISEKLGYLVEIDHGFLINYEKPCDPAVVGVLEDQTKSRNLDSVRPLT